MHEPGDENRFGPNSLDKERSLLNDDPKWLDTTYVLANYKTEPCKKPPRLCRQGYACPQFHNNKDRRRSPRKYKYRSTPCPAVKTADEWGDPANCDTGDNCQYCHTRYAPLPYLADSRPNTASHHQFQFCRTEQQFHPEIYKSTKCNDIQNTSYCPRGAFCAFAHQEREYLASLSTKTASSSSVHGLAIINLLDNRGLTPSHKAKRRRNLKSSQNYFFNLSWRFDSWESLFWLL